MKRIFTIILITICGMTAMAQDRPDMTHQSTGRDRIEFVFGSNPIITYSEFSQVLTVNANIFVNHFELTIRSVETYEIVFQDVFEGATAAISVADLTDGKYYQVEYVDSNGLYYVKMFEKISSWFDSFDIQSDLNNVYRLK